MSKNRGFSLIEIVLAMTLLSLGLIVAFSLFERGSRALMLSDTKSGLGGESRRAILGLSSALRLGDSRLAEVLSPPRQTLSLSGNTVERGAYSLPTLRRWDEPSNFDQIEAQIYWDSYTVVYATLAQEGSLVVQTYEPATPPPPYYEPLNALSSFLADNPQLNTGAVATRLLTQKVEEFRAELDSETSVMRLTLRLAQRGGKKTGARAMDERAEATAAVRMFNSGPK